MWRVWLHDDPIRPPGSVNKPKQGRGLKDGVVSPTLSPGSNGASGAGSPFPRVLANYRLELLPRAPAISSPLRSVNRLKQQGTMIHSWSHSWTLTFPGAGGRRSPGAPGSCYLAWGGGGV